MRYLVFLGIVLLGIATAAHLDAQQPTPSSPAQPGEQSGAMGGMMPMEMCRQMMAGHMMGGGGMGAGGMGAGMMGMSMGGGAQMDPKTRAEMLEMRGEMMKAMGEIMMRHAKKLQGSPAR